MATRCQTLSFGVFLAVLFGSFSSGVFAHGTASRPPKGSVERAIEFPDTRDYRTLVADLHTHTVFSDGHVWPRIRVAEALRDGLDALAITDHLEWQPHLADIPHPDRNRSYAEALSALGDADLIIIRGSEITRDAPARHMNAVFIQDANKLLRPPTGPLDPADAREYFARAGEWPAQEAVQSANDQGAFVFWNHPFFSAEDRDGIARITSFHRRNARRGLLHGIEIANGDTYSEEAFQIALDHDLALIGVSDVHNLIDWDYEPHAGGHRPVTLVFARERTADALREALFAKRTVVWFQNLLLGRAEHLNPLLEASLSMESPSYRGATEIASVTLKNHSDVHFLLRNLSPYTFVHQADVLEVPPHESLEIMLKPGTRVTSIELEFEVLNALVAPKEYARLRASLSLEGE